LSVRTLVLNCQWFHEPMTTLRCDAEPVSRPAIYTRRLHPLDRAAVFQVSPPLSNQTYPLFADTILSIVKTEPLNCWLLSAINLEPLPASLHHQISPSSLPGERSVKIVLGSTWFSGLMFVIALSNDCPKRLPIFSVRRLNEPDLCFYPSSYLLMGDPFPELSLR